MKILIFNWRDIKHPQAGGAELFFHELAKRWSALGNKVIWISGGWKNCQKTENIDGINIIRAGKEESLYLLAPIEYLRLKEKPDIIIDVENGIPFFSPFFSSKKKILHIHHIHRDVWFRQEGFPLAHIGWFLETKLMPLVYRSKAIVTISNSSREEIKEEGLRNVLGVVNPGIELPKYKQYKKDKSPTVLFLNRIKKYKGIDTFLEAASELKNTSIKFTVAGSGDYLDEAKEHASKKRLNNVHFLGRVSEAKKRELMQKSWVFINPSFKEGWGIVNIEANYFGTPVIGSNVSGIKDSVVEGKTGLLFKYGDSKDLAEKIMRIIEDRKLRKNMEKHGKHWASKFNWDTKAKEYLMIIRDYINA